MGANGIWSNCFFGPGLLLYPTHSPAHKTTMATVAPSFIGARLSVARPARRVQSARATVRASTAPAAPAAPAPWSPPTLDPNTPSPIFGGSTGGLLRKAQVRRGPPPSGETLAEGGIPFVQGREDV